MLSERPQLTAFIPAHYSAQRHYVLQIVAEDFWGISINIEKSETADTILQSQTTRLEIPDHFFSNYERWKSGETPDVKTFQLVGPGGKSYELPGWFYGDSTNFEPGRKHNKLPTDIIGMSFFLLSGFADLTLGELDKHGRQIGTTSFVARQNLIDRPILQEWFHLIAELLFGPEYRTKLNLPPYHKHTSHDVDQPFEYLYYTKSRLMKRLSGDLLARKNLSLAKRRYSIWRNVQRGRVEVDPFNNFDELISLFREHNHTSTFFWVTGEAQSSYDVNYTISDPPVLDQLLKVAEAGHTIGLHPSYTSLGKSDQLLKERSRLEELLAKNGLDLPVTHERKHVLRWNWETSPDALSGAGFTHDYTVGYADRSGYRTGVGFPYRAYSWQTNKITSLRLHPLIVMECTLLDDRYMGCSVDETMGRIKLYHNQLSNLGGEFVLLWHNHRLSEPSELNLFTQFLSL